jgi:DNA segregation ATPase FtsK/SpoIIIE, S-DNA-T family
MVKPEQRSEMVGVALLALALVLLLALLPVALLGSAGARWFPSGNMIGVVGRTLQEATWGVFGLGAGLLPVVAALAGLLAGGWMDREAALRTGVFTLGLAVLLPLGLFLLPAGPGWSGWLGGVLGGPLSGALGVVGAGVATGAAFVLLSVATLEWNPLRAPARWGWLGLRQGAATLRGGIGRARAAARERAEARAQAEVSAGAEAWDADGGDPFGPEPDEDLLPEADPGPGISGTGVPAGAEAGHPAQAAPGAAGRAKRPGDQLDLLPDPIDPRELAGHELPGLELLTAPSRKGRQGMERELDALGEVLVEKLRTFNVESHIGGRTTGPVVTQYEVVPAPGVKVNRIANLDADLALAMKAKTIRIVAPIPGKGAVGVEIPNPRSEMVQLREILDADVFARARGELPLALGKDLHGEPYVADLAKMPHALIAGATGSGKSVCLNTVITSLVYRHTPETLRLLLIDPKMVELSTYADLPHLRHPVVTDPKDAAGVLKWAVLEMERRYTLLKENGVRSLGEFNRGSGRARSCGGWRPWVTRATRTAGSTMRGSSPSSCSWWTSSPTS